MNEIRWGIIGCGDVTEMKSGPAFNKVPQSKLVAVMRRDAEKAADYARRHGVEKWYNNAEELIHDKEVNAIYVATPPAYHEMYALASLQAGKPVYVEKPMAISAQASSQINEAAKNLDIKLCVAHYRRQLPLFKKIKQLLEAETIGKISYINLKMVQPHKNDLITQTPDNWRTNPEVSGGGLFHDLAPHQLDLMLYYFGHCKKATGIATNQGQHYAATDLVTGNMLFEENIMFSGLWNFNAPSSETTDICEIVGSKGKFTFSIFKHDTLLWNNYSEVKTLTFNNPPHVQMPMIEKVVQYFLNHSGNPCSGDEGVEVMQMMDAIHVPG